MPESEHEITPAQVSAITMLVAGHAYGDIAERLGIDPKTLWRWRQDPAFARALKEAQECALCGVRDRLAAMTERALGALDSAMAGESDGARVAAARAVLDRVLGPVKASESTEAERPTVMVMATPEELRAEIERRMQQRNGHI